MSNRYKVKFPNEVNNVVREVAYALNSSLLFIGLVGGCVRDTLLGLPINDYDIVICNDPAPNSPKWTIEKVCEKLPGSFIVGKSCPIIIYKGYEISVKNSIEEDAINRDFTVNAIYCKYLYGGGYEIMGVHHWQHDIENRILRINGNAEEIFTKDPIRILRALRLAAKCRLEIEKETYYEIFRLRHLLINADIHEDRLFNEFRKGFTCGHAYEFVKLLDEFELLEHFFPAVHALKNVDGGHYHNETVYHHVLGALKALDNTKLPFELKLAALYHDVGKQKWEITEDGKRRFSNHAVFGAELVESDLSRLKFPRGVKVYVKTIVYNHMRQMDGKKSISRLVHDLKRGKIPLKHFVYLRYSDNKGNHRTKTDFKEHWKRYRFCLQILNPKHVPSVKDLKINGRTLMMELKIEQGKIIGTILKILFEKVVAGELENKKKVLIEEAVKIHGTL